MVLPCALLSTWLHAVVSDTDRYVDTVAPLARDEVVQRAAQAKLEQVVLTAINAEGRRFQATIKTVVHNATVRVIEAPEFPPAWEAANRSAHEQLIVVLAGDEDQLFDADGRISVQLNTLVTTVVGILDADGIVDASQLPEMEASFTFVQAGELDKARNVYTILNALGFWLPVLWLLLVAVAVLLAVDRRQSIRWLAYGSIIGLLLLMIGLRVARNRLIGADLVDEDLTLAVWNILLAGLKTSIWILLAGSLLVAVAEWLTGPTRSAARVRTLVGGSSDASTGPDMSS